MAISMTAASRAIAMMMSITAIMTAIMSTTAIMLITTITSSTAIAAVASTAITAAEVRRRVERRSTGRTGPHFGEKPMSHYPIKLLAFAALAAAISAGPAAAGGYSCCSCVGGCAPVWAAPPVTGPFYIVDQGPNYVGPGIVLVPGYVEVDTAPATYPYVGRDYYFPSYPGVYHHHHHHKYRHD
jgi:hypothetical protein